MRALALLAALSIAGCARDAATPPGTCDAGKVQGLVGKRADAVQEDATARSGAGSARRYRTGDPVTMDYRADRLNIETDANGTIVRLSCG